MALERELTLDPDDWDAFAALAHRMVDETLDHLRTLRERPAWTPPPVDVKRLVLDEPVPMEAQGEWAVYEQFKRHVLPYRTGNLDPRFYGWVQGNGTPLGMMADMLAAGMNPHLAGFNQMPAQVEAKVVDWLRELMGFPTGSSGILLSGGSMASITGLAIARNAKAGFDVRARGVQAKDQPTLTVYGSAETHSWARKAMELLGLGHQALRIARTNDDFTIDVDDLRRLIEEDRRNGLRPVAVLGTAGTVNTGATDDLAALADLCSSEGLWLHVDGAFGALAALSDSLRPIVAGLERADSVAFDLHKWMYLPFECACLLVRDGDAHRAAFSQTASYIAGTERGVIAGGLWLADLGVELSRSFKALKVWMSMKAHGVGKIAALIEQNVDQAPYLADLVEREPTLEIMAPVPLNIVCFRFVDEELNLEQIELLNKELLLRLQERGIAVPSSTVLSDRYCLRACVVNHRTRREDLHSLVRNCVEIGKEIATELRAGGRGVDS